MMPSSQRPPGAPDAKSRRNIYLTGFSGTGKSHSGRLAARSLGMEFVDTDELVEKAAKKPIPEIFSGEGEAQFRALESAVLADVATEGGKVVSTGGGVPVLPANRELMSRTGLVVRLKATPESIQARLTRAIGTSGRAVRPLLGGDAPVEKVRALLEEREAAYASADVTVDTEGKTPGDVAREVVLAWRRSARAAGGQRSASRG